MGKQLVQVRRYGDLINTDLSVESAVSIHGPENVLVDGVCFADVIAAARKQAESRKKSGDKKPAEGKEGGDKKPAEGKEGGDA